MSSRARLEGLNVDSTLYGIGDSRVLTTQGGRAQALTQQTMRREGAVYTIGFGVVPPADADGNAFPYSCEAIIRASEGGNAITRRISVVNGTSISIPGRIFEIRIQDTTPLVMPISGDATPGEGSPYRVTVLVEIGNRVLGHGPPTLYHGIATIVGHASETIPIPQDSGATSVQVAVIDSTAFPTTAPNVAVKFVSGTGIWKEYSPTIQSGFVAIPPGATDITIVNADAVNSVNASVTWGIDG